MTFKTWMFRLAAPLIAIGLLLPGAASAQDVLASGSFVGKSNHRTSGRVEVVKTAAGHRIVLKGDFRFDGAPDPVLGFGKDGYVAKSQFGPLRSIRGEQTYELPNSIDPAQFNEVWLWCEKYSVPLGYAKLQ